MENSITKTVSSWEIFKKMSQMGADWHSKMKTIITGECSKMDNFMVLEKNMDLTSPSRESFNRDSGRKDCSKTKNLSTMENSKITSFMETALLSFKME